MLPFGDCHIKANNPQVLPSAAGSSLCIRGNPSNNVSFFTSSQNLKEFSAL
jgi:hypothetical protein